MAAGAALIALKTTAVNQHILTTAAEWTAEIISSARLLRDGLTLLLCSVQLLELRQREAMLEQDAVASHNPSSIYLLA